jgi:hypothetical protein
MLYVFVRPHDSGFLASTTGHPALACNSCLRIFVMKAFVSGVLAALVLATVAAVVLDTSVQQSAKDAFTTRGARPS